MIYIVTRNDEIDEVFSTREAAEKFIKQRGWNIFRIVERKIND